MAELLKEVRTANQVLQIGFAIQAIIDMDVEACAEMEDQFLVDRPGERAVMREVYQFLREAQPKLRALNERGRAAHDQHRARN